MWENILIVTVVLVALGGVGYGLFRTASGKSGCAGCKCKAAETAQCENGTADGGISKVEGK